MPELLSWIGVLIGAVVAACCAGADGAMLTLDGEGPLSPQLRQLFVRRERTHRALAFARVLAQLTTGLSVALALDLAVRPLREALAIAAVSAVLLVGASESLARS